MAFVLQMLQTYTSKRRFAQHFWKKLWTCWRSKHISKLTLMLWDQGSEEYSITNTPILLTLKKLFHILHQAFPLIHFSSVCKYSNNLLTTASCVRDATVWNTAGIIRDSSTFNSISFSAENVVLGIAGGRSHKIISLLNKKIGLVSYTRKGNQTLSKGNLLLNHELLPHVGNESWEQVKIYIYKLIT